MPKQLIITRGLPASGKTTWARAWVALSPRDRVRVNRDDLRENMFGIRHGLTYEQEQAVTRVQHAAVKAALNNDASVVVDDTHLKLKHARAWADLAQQVGAEFGVVDFNTHPDTCVARDAVREHSVGEKVIRDLAARFDRRESVLPTPTMKVEPYEPDTTLPRAWLVDIDGTLARMTGRSPYEWHRVHEDEPVEAVCEIVRALAVQTNTHIVVMSGRDESCRGATLKWLNAHLIPFDALEMRPEGDMRKDSIVKRELFLEHVAPRWNIVGVLDDRNSVVDMWRAMGLMCAQVAPGDF